MAEYKNLFSAHARRTDPTPSHQAADMVRKKITRIREQVLRQFAYAHHGLTDLELETRFNDHGSTYRTRRSELVVIGYVRDSGKTTVQNGSTRTVWIITNEGQQAYLRLGNEKS